MFTRHAVQFTQASIDLLQAMWVHVDVIKIPLQGAGRFVQLNLCLIQHVPDFVEQGVCIIDVIDLLQGPVNHLAGGIVAGVSAVTDDHGRLATDQGILCTG